jgi:phytoene dehydrogenase-like protein
MPGGPRDHAVVIGASIAGLCAARVLSDFYGLVTVFERDDLPGTPANRATVPTHFTDALAWAEPASPSTTQG